MKELTNLKLIEKNYINRDVIFFGTLNKEEKRIEIYFENRSNRSYILLQTPEFFELENLNSPTFLTEENDEDYFYLGPHESFKPFCFLNLEDVETKKVKYRYKNMNFLKSVAMQEHTHLENGLLVTVQQFNFPSGEKRLAFQAYNKSKTTIVVELSLNQLQKLTPIGDSFKKANIMLPHSTLHYGYLKIEDRGWSYKYNTDVKPAKYRNGTWMKPKVIIQNVHLLGIYDETKKQVELYIYNKKNSSILLRNMQWKFKDCSVDFAVKRNKLIFPHESRGEAQLIIRLNVTSDDFAYDYNLNFDSKSCFLQADPIKRVHFNAHYFPDRKFTVIEVKNKTFSDKSIHLKFIRLNGYKILDNRYNEDSLMQIKPFEKKVYTTLGITGDMSFFYKIWPDIQNTHPFAGKCRKFCISKAKQKLNFNKEIKQNVQKNISFGKEDNEKDDASTFDDIFIDDDEDKDEINLDDDDGEDTTFDDNVWGDNDDEDEDEGEDEDDEDDDFEIDHPEEENDPLIIWNEDSKDTISDWVQKIIDAGEKWEDPEFGPNQSSINQGREDKCTGKYEWKRCSEIMKNQELFTESIEADDIKQGALGNCWFMSCISVVAHMQPEKIVDLFVTRKINEAGIYELKLFQAGKWVRVVVDDYVPCLPYSIYPAFAKSNNNEIWVILLEKAYAKLHGSYALLTAGFACHGLTDLTHSPSQYYPKQSYDKDKYFELMKEFCSLQLPITTSMLSSTKGLVSNHAYGLLNVKEVDGIKLVQLRNPYSHSEWQGDFADKSESWTNDLKEVCGWEIKNDGVFWMTYEDYYKYSGSINVCWSIPNSFQKSFNLTLSPENSLTPMLLIKSNADTKSKCCFYQKAKRCIDVESNFKTKFGSFNSNKVHYLSSSDRDSLKDVDIPAGEDVYVCLKGYDLEKPTDTVLTVFSPQDLDIQQIDNQEEILSKFSKFSEV
mmetsp:Transcript_3176/g.4691  ORF Transcript_3176/g.4691 Transcript_3176/m.4691 type:complete len:945 (-) Transcript_3176:34-2868(-)